MMTILFAPDKFKGSLNAAQVAQAMEEGMREGGFDFNAFHLPMADGGEGTCDMLTRFTHGQKISLMAPNPLGQIVPATYGISGDGDTAFIEMAAASGLQILKPHERNPLETSTAGTGRLIHHAVEEGVKQIVLGIGGSATNDAGMGVLDALGVLFFNNHGERLQPIGKNLVHLDHIDASHVEPAAQRTSIIALCDVNNPLHGPEGAAHVFGPQKGADVAAVKLLDDGLRNFAAVVQRQFGVDINFPGAGAGGGIGAGLKAFLNVTFQSGMDFLKAFVKLEDKVAESHIVFTGEGRVDHQTLYGKVVKGVAELAVKHGKPLFIVAGTSDLTPQDLLALGAVKVVNLVNAATPEKEAMQHAFSLIRQRVKEEIIPLFL